MPPEIVVKLLQQAMEQIGWEGGTYLIDLLGSFANFEAFEKTLGSKVFVKLALLFDCPEEVMQDRLLEQSESTGRVDEKDSIRKRLQTLSQSEPDRIVEKLQSEGLLRRIDASQDVEEVWACAQEVMKAELEANHQNQAVILVKPHAQNKESDRFVQSFLAKHKIAVLRKGIVSTTDIKERNLFAKQYSQILQVAEADPKSLTVSVADRERFRDTFGVEWADALSNDEVLNCARAQELMGLSAKALYEETRQAEQASMAHSLHVARVSDGRGKRYFVINAYVPFMREEFIGSYTELQYMVVAFSPKKVSWKRFRSEILGSTNPTKASHDSIRGQMYAHWRALGLQAPPDMMNNCVHASAGPIEALYERILWTGVAITEDPFGRLLLSSGVPLSSIEAWLENPYIEGWKVGKTMMSNKIFSCSEDCDTAVVRDSAVKFAKEKLGGLQSWSCSLPTSPASRMGTKRTQTPSKGSKASVSSGPKPKVMTILHFNDVYNVEPRVKEPVGGIARFVTKVRELKADSIARGEPEAVVLFSGDAFNPSLTSTVTKGRHMVPALNAIGVHTACYGNHDFDFGVDQLEKMAAENNFPWLISNVTSKATGKPLADGLVTRMLDFHGRKVGLIGLVEREWLVTLATLDPSEVDFEDFCPCGRRLAKQLKEKMGAEIVVALTHMRVPNDELLAHEVEEIDIILGGHDHHYDVKPVGPFGTYVLKSGTDFRDITVLRLEFTDSGAKPFKILDDKHIEIEGSIPEDPEMKVFVDECLGQVGSAMDKVIGETATDLDCRFSEIRTRETNVGNFVTDIMRNALKADIGFLNSGTLRADAIIEKGIIKVRDLVNLLPMLDELCLLQVTGSQLLCLLENSVSQYPRLEGRFAQVSGVTFTFDAARPGGQRLEEATIRVGGQPLDKSKKYKLVTKDYLRQGKDGYDVFRETVCLADGEQAGILPTIVRDHFHALAVLNGMTADAPVDSLQRARACEKQGGLTKVGDGPADLQKFAINPAVEDRIVCLNPAS